MHFLLYFQGFLNLVIVESLLHFQIMNIVSITPTPYFFFLILKEKRYLENQSDVSETVGSYFYISAVIFNPCINNVEPL